MEFIEIKMQQELEKAYEVIRELAPELDKDRFFRSLSQYHELGQIRQF